MKCDHFAPQWRSPLAVLLTLVGLGILLGLTPLPSQADEGVDPADLMANYEDESEEDYQDMEEYEMAVMDSLLDQMENMEAIPEEDIWGR